MLKRWSLALTIMLCTQLAAAETVLKASIWLPPTHPLVKDVLVPWAKSVQDATAGSVKVVIDEAPTPGPAQYDMLREGKVDIVAVPNSYAAERFSVYQLVEMPLLTPSAEIMSVAYWRTYQKVIQGKVDEYQDVHLLSLFTHGPGEFWNVKWPIVNFEDLDGLKLRVPGGAISRMLRNMGVVSVQAPTSAARNLLETKVVDGVVFPMETALTLKLAPPIRYVSTVPGGFYNVGFYLAINRQAWEKLSPAERGAIERVSGEKFARLAGQAWDQADSAAAKRLREVGIEANEVGSELKNELIRRSLQLRAQLTEQLAGKGIDAKAFLAELEVQLAALRK